MAENTQPVERIASPQLSEAKVTKRAELRRDSRSWPSKNRSATNLQSASQKKVIGSGNVRNHRCLTTKQLSVSKLAPCQRHKDNLSKVEPILTIPLIEPRTASLTGAFARRTDPSVNSFDVEDKPVSRSILASSADPLQFCKTTFERPPRAQIGGENCRSSYRPRTL
jgi:hypothetical protein